MKKVLVVSLMVSLLASVSSAQLLIGSKAGGMGGTGVASVTDLAAVYYNPASLMRSGGGGVKIALGAAYSDPTDLSEALSKASDAATFIIDNYSSSLSFNGSLDGVLGLNINKVGISVLPLASASVAKDANTLVGSFNVSGQYAGVLTLGHTYSVPFLPAALDIGINAKTITAYMGGITTTGTPTNASGSRTYSTGTGMGFDVGALTSFDVPMVTSFKAGIVARNISQSITYSNKSQNSYLDFSTGTGVLTTDAEVSLPDSTTTVDPSYAIGASAVIPGINLLIAADIEMLSSASNTHIGIEYPLLASAVILRGGLASGNNLSKTTIGAKVNIPFFTLDAVSVTDANNSGQTSYILDIGIGI